MENQTLRTHFGELIRPAKYGFKLTRDKYLNESRKNHKPLSKVLITSLRERDQKYCELMDSIFEDEWWRTYRPEIAEEMRARALKNFDLNMAYFSQLDAKEFEHHVAQTVKSFSRIRRVERLADWEETGGVYVMVLGEHRQVYVGQSNNIRKRIKAHWGGAISISKAVFGRVDQSIMSIASFRALDTTAIYATEVPDFKRDKVEEDVESSFDQKYVLNRIDAGRPDDVRIRFMAFEARRREL